MASRLTFGVEFEFALATLNLTGRDPNPEDRRRVIRMANKDYSLACEHVQNIIAESLTEAGLPARRENMEILADDEEPTGAEWLVGIDNSVKSPNTQYTWFPIEVKSPPLYYSTEALQVVQWALHVLTKRFRLHVDDTCGLHVHVGNSSSGFDFKTFRSLMAFLWTFEPVLCQLHPNRPFGEDTTAGSYYYPPLRKVTPLAGFGQSDQWYPSVRESAIRSKTITVQEGLSAILQETDSRGLMRLLYAGRRLAYNIENLQEPFRYAKKRTIEFRQHEGCLDGGRVVAWIQTVVGIVDYAQGCSLAAFTELVTRHARMEDRDGTVSNVIDLLHDIGLPEPVKFYSSWLPKNVSPFPPLNSWVRRRPWDSDGSDTSDDIDDYTPVWSPPERPESPYSMW